MSRQNVGTMLGIIFWIGLALVLSAIFIPISMQPIAGVTDMGNNSYTLSDNESVEPHSEINITNNISSESSEINYFGYSLGNDSSHQIRDIRTKNLLANISAQNARGIHFGSENKYLFLGDSNTLKIYDTSWNQVTTKSLSGRPESIDNLNESYISVLTNDGEMYIYEYGTWDLVTKKDSSGAIVVANTQFSNDGKYIARGFEGNGLVDHIEIFEVSSWSSLTNITLPYVYEFGFSSNSDYLLVGNVTSDALEKYNVGTWDIADSVSIGSNPENPQTHPTKDKVVFIDGNTNLNVYYISNLTQKNIFTNVGFNGKPAITQDWVMTHGSDDIDFYEENDNTYTHHSEYTASLNKFDVFSTTDTNTTSSFTVLLEDTTQVVTLEPSESETISSENAELTIELLSESESENNINTTWSVTNPPDANALTIANIIPFVLLLFAFLGIVGIGILATGKN